MKILLYASGFVDLEAPINMTQEQFDVFSDFFNENFPNVEFVPKKEAVKKFGSKESEHKEWTLDDYLLLLEPVSNEILSPRMGRTDMSIRMKRGEFVPDFFAWMKEKGYLTWDKDIVDDFFRDRGRA